MNSIQNKHVNTYLNELSWRDRIIFNIGISTGLRITDILHLKRADVFKGKFVVKERKTKKSKKISLNNDLLNDIKNYDKLYHIKYKKLLFINPKTNKPYTRQAIYYHFRNIAKLLNTHTSPHSMRQTYAKELYKKTKSLKAVQKALNHNSSNTTKIYLKRNKSVK